MNGNDWLKPKEVAERIGLSVNTVYLLIHQGRIKSSRVGPMSGRHRVKASDVEAYLESCATRGVSTTTRLEDGVYDVPHTHF